jgi:predicted CXXCH cytochrome family protein
MGTQSKRVLRNQDGRVTEEKTKQYLRRMKMKKTFTKAALGIGMATLMSLPVIASAKIVGNCSDCHTMHNSEQGNPVALVQGWTGVSPTPNAVLLKMDCMSCHASGSGNNLDILAGGSVVPQVYGTYAADLAGGNFAYIDGVKGSGASDRKGHNVIDILDADGTLTGPPGYARGPANDQTNNTSIHTFAMASQFTCAGKAGCHGVRNQAIADAVADIKDANGVVITPGTAAVPRVGLAALTGAHHYDATGDLSVADDIYNSFRFLMGTKGYEVYNWYNEASSHNEYSGANNVVFGVGGEDTGCGRCHVESHGMETVGYVTNVSGTMTNFCETCHSNFHSSQADSIASGGFLRHPSDFVIQDKTEYTAIGDWDVTAPVARQDWTGGVSTAAGPGDVVMCLSCHVAHASDYPAMLRFDYTAINAGGGDNTTGCFVCHTTKDTGDGNTWLNPMLQP